MYHIRWSERCLPLEGTKLKKKDFDWPFNYWLGSGKGCFTPPNQKFLVAQFSPLSFLTHVKFYKKVDTQF